MSSRRFLAWPLLGAVLGLDLLAFAGVDSLSRFLFALAIAVLVLTWRLGTQCLDPGARRLAWLWIGLGTATLIPLPQGLRQLLQPGLADLSADGWAALSVSPWISLLSIAQALVLIGVASLAAGLATRRGHRKALMTLSVLAFLLSFAGLIGEAGAPAKVLLLRANPQSGSVYGPFINKNHYALAMELLLPAAFALALLGLAGLRGPGRQSLQQKHRAVLTALFALATLAIGGATLLRCGSLGGSLAFVAGFALSGPFWLRRASRRALLIGGVAAGLSIVFIVAVAGAKAEALESRFRSLASIEGASGNDRWALWSGSLATSRRAPLLGSGPGTYALVIGLDKPATGRSRLRHAHNAWLERGVEGGLAGVALALAALLYGLRRAWQKARSDHLATRLGAAAAAWALLAVSLHELIGFGLTRPANAALLALWAGTLVSIGNHVAEAEQEESPE